MDCSPIPTRAELKELDDAAARALPDDPTPSLAEIAARPDVRHLGRPAPAPQRPEEPLRAVVIGTDAALSAVLTRAMRADYLWVEFGFVPIDASVAAINWGLPEDPSYVWEAPVRPAPLIRDDKGIAVAGSATLTAASGGEYTGEIIVDDATLLFHRATEGSTPLFGAYGARLVPMVDEPGILAARLLTPLCGWPGHQRFSLSTLHSLWRNPGTRWLTRRAAQPAAVVDPDRPLRGRAVQTGGVGVLVSIDGVPAKRPVKRSTFYRHLRDLQVVRP